MDAGVEIQQVEVIGPQVGGELLSSAWQALAATLLLIAGYIALRFHTWRLSLGAILAVLHDPILVLGRLFADPHDVRSDRGGGDAGGDRLFAQ